MLFNSGHPRSFQVSDVVQRIHRHLALSVRISALLAAASALVAHAEGQECFGPPQPQPQRPLALGAARQAQLQQVSVELHLHSTGAQSHRRIKKPCTVETYLHSANACVKASLAGSACRCMHQAGMVVEGILFAARLAWNAHHERMALDLREVAAVELVLCVYGRPHRLL